MNARTDPARPWWIRHAALFNGLSCDDQGRLHADGRCFTPHAHALAFDAPSVLADPRVTALQQHLYRRYYTGLDHPAAAPPPVWQPAAEPPLISGPWHVLEQWRDGAVVARRGTRVRRLEPGEYLFDGTPARAGRHHQVIRQRPRASTLLDPAFQYLYGEAEADACDDDAMVRYYAAPHPARLGQLVTTLRQALDQAKLPFSLKYPLTPQALWRHDAVVLYVCARHAPQLHALLARLAPTLGPLLRPVHALWTLPLLPGLGFAQDPVDELSFGESRCLALAQGLFDAAMAHDGEALKRVRTRFSAAGIDWDTPHLEIDDDDRFGLRRLRFTPAVARPRAHAPEIADARLWQETLAIGNQLCADALWHGEGCSWINDDADDESGQLAPFARSMNGSLYDGTVGVAAYLAQLAWHSQDAAHRDTAVGALWHALRQPTPVSISLYEGRLGTVSQGLHIAKQLAKADLVDSYAHAAHALLDQLPDDETDTDLMHGLAGAILSLLAMARQLPALSERALAHARHYGERLIDLAQQAPQGWHWPSGGHTLGLCGLSHGNAGIMLAFADLQRATPSPAWQPAIQGALAYETFWHLPRQGNWPYLFAEDASGFDDQPDHCGMAWCHGAPGVALSRLALWRLTGDASARQAALATFDTVARDLSSPHSQAGDSYTLCHGPAGNADMLLDAARLLAQPQWERLAQDVARQGVARQAGQWRSGLGVADGHALGLMLGLAGTGYFLLRCATRAPVPSLMLPFGLLEQKSRLH